MAAAAFYTATGGLGSTTPYVSKRAAAGIAEPDCAEPDVAILHARGFSMVLNNSGMTAKEL
eukprot:10046852-Lingulodinium_polyedra.AAC.1